MKGCKLQLVPPVTERPRSTPAEEYATSEVIFLCGYRNLSPEMSFNSALNLHLFSMMNSEDNWESLGKSTVIVIQKDAPRIELGICLHKVEESTSVHGTAYGDTDVYDTSKNDLIYSIFLWNNDKPNHTHRTN